MVPYGQFWPSWLVIKGLRNQRIKTMKKINDYDVKQERSKGKFTPKHLIFFELLREFGVCVNITEVYLTPNLTQTTTTDLEK